MPSGGVLIDADRAPGTPAAPEVVHVPPSEVWDCRNGRRSQCAPPRRLLFNHCSNAFHFLNTYGDPVNCGLITHTRPHGELDSSQQQDGRHVPPLRPQVVGGEV